MSENMSVISFNTDFEHYNLLHIAANRVTDRSIKTL